MSSDFLAGVNQGLLNQVSNEVYPAIKGKLTQTSQIDSPAATVTWTITQAPVFDLSQNSGNTFKLNVVLRLDITPTGGSPSSESLQASGACQVAVSGEGMLGFMLNDLTFTTQDPFVAAILAAKKQAMISTLEALLQSVQIPLGPVEGTTFTGYATGIQNGVLYAAGSVAGAASIDQVLNVGNGFGIGVSNALMKNIVQNVWWASTPKSFRPNDDVTINLNGYSFAVSGGQLLLTLNLGGDVYIDEGLGTAHWSVSISPVYANINISIDANRHVNLAGGSVSTPGVSVNPENFLADISSVIPIAPIIAILIQNDIPGSISGHLSGSVFTVPVINTSFQGINFSVTPTGLNLSVNGSEVIVTGSASVAVG